MVSKRLLPVTGSPAPSRIKRNNAKMRLMMRRTRKAEEHIPGVKLEKVKLKRHQKKVKNNEVLRERVAKIRERHDNIKLRRQMPPKIKPVNTNLEG